jgi:hypothetical protein
LFTCATKTFVAYTLGNRSIIKEKYVLSAWLTILFSSLKNAADLNKLTKTIYGYLTPKTIGTGAFTIALLKFRLKY